MKNVAPVRKELGVRTLFNILGPLTNPAGPRSGLIGCAFGDLAEVVAGLHENFDPDVLDDIIATTEKVRLTEIRKVVKIVPASDDGPAVVVDEDGQPVPGVTIKYPETTAKVVAMPGARTMETGKMPSTRKQAASVAPETSTVWPLERSDAYTASGMLSPARSDPLRCDSKNSE
jgi:hypothetical protein